MCFFLCWSFQFCATAGGLYLDPHNGMQNLQNISQMAFALQVRLPSCSSRTEIPGVAERVKQNTKCYGHTEKNLLPSLTSERISRLGLKPPFTEQVFIYFRVVYTDEKQSINSKL